MKCPLCQSELISYSGPDPDNGTGYRALECEAAQCLNDDMPRYKMMFENGALVTRTLQYEGVHVAIDYRNGVTVISKLIACFLTDSIRLPRVLDFDDKDPYALYTKVKTLMLFS